MQNPDDIIRVWEVQKTGTITIFIVIIIVLTIFTQWHSKAVLHLFIFSWFLSVSRSLGQI